MKLDTTIKKAISEVDQMEGLANLIENEQYSFISEEYKTALKKHNTKLRKYLDEVFYNADVETLKTVHEQTKLSDRVYRFLR